MSKFVWLLDPGHGGIDPKTKEYVTPGKRSPKFKDGSVLYEGVIMRNIVKYIGEMLTMLKIDFHYVVNPTNFKDVDLNQRVKFCNSMGRTTSCVVISVHSNAHGDGSKFTDANGFEVFTSEGDTKSDKLAEVFINEYKKQLPNIKLRSDLTDKDLDKEANFAMVSKTISPAILIETAFHTNEKEALFLKSAEGQKKIASAIVEGIKKIEGL